MRPRARKKAEDEYIGVKDPDCIEERYIDDIIG